MYVSREARQEAVKLAKSGDLDSAYKTLLATYSEPEVDKKLVNKVDKLAEKALRICQRGTLREARVPVSEALEAFEELRAHIEYQLNRDYESVGPPSDR